MVDVGTHESASPPAAPRLSKDVAETLASLKAMAHDIALSDAEKAQQQTAPLATQVSPELVNLATAASELRERSDAIRIDRQRAGRSFGSTPDSDFRADEKAVRASYWSGVRDGMLASMLFIGCFVLLVLIIGP